MSEQHGSHDGPTRADGAVAVRGGSIEPVLSERDLTLLRCLAAGGSTVDVAAILSVSTNTARTRIRRVAGKLSVAGRGRLVPSARDRGLI